MVKETLIIVYQHIQPYIVTLFLKIGSFLNSFLGPLKEQPCNGFFHYKIIQSTHSMSFFDVVLNHFQVKMGPKIMVLPNIMMCKKQQGEKSHKFYRMLSIALLTNQYQPPQCGSSMNFH